MDVTGNLHAVKDSPTLRQGRADVNKNTFQLSVMKGLRGGALQAFSQPGFHLTKDIDYKGTGN